MLQSIDNIYFKFNCDQNRGCTLYSYRCTRKQWYNAPRLFIALIVHWVCANRLAHVPPVSSLLAWRFFASMILKELSAFSTHTRERRITRARAREQARERERERIKERIGRARLHASLRSPRLDRAISGDRLLINPTINADDALPCPRVVISRAEFYERPLSYPSSFPVLFLHPPIHWISTLSLFHMWRYQY